MNVLLVAGGEHVVTARHKDIIKRRVLAKLELLRPVWLSYSY